MRPPSAPDVTNIGIKGERMQRRYYPSNRAPAPVPTESAEQQLLFQWAKIQERVHPELCLLYHIANEGKRNERLRRERNTAVDILRRSSGSCAHCIYHVPALFPNGVGNCRSEPSGSPCMNWKWRGPQDTGKRRDKNT